MFSALHSHASYTVILHDNGEITLESAQNTQLSFLLVILLFEFNLFPTFQEQAVDLSFVLPLLTSLTKEYTVDLDPKSLLLPLQSHVSSSRQARALPSRIIFYACMLFHAAPWLCTLCGVNEHTSV